MKDLVLQAGARADIGEVCRYYDERSDTAGDRFLVELNSILTRIVEMPTAFPPFHSDPDFRKAKLDVFPYEVVYRETPKQIRVIMVRHEKRHPDFGIDRISRI